MHSALTQPSTLALVPPCFPFKPHSPHRLATRSPRHSLAGRVGRGGGSLCSLFPIKTLCPCALRGEQLRRRSVPNPFKTLCSLCFCGEFPLDFLQYSLGYCLSSLEQGSLMNRRPSENPRPGQETCPFQGIKQFQRSSFQHAPAIFVHFRALSGIFASRASFAPPVAPFYSLQPTASLVRFHELSPIVTTMMVPPQVADQVYRGRVAGLKPKRAPFGQLPADQPQNRQASKKGLTRLFPIQSFDKDRYSCYSAPNQSSADDIAFGPNSCPTESPQRHSPEDVPANSPSHAPKRWHLLRIGVLTAMIQSTRPGSHSGGVKPIPIPSIVCAPLGARKTADSWLHDSNLNIGLLRLSTVGPREDAPVPTHYTNASTAPLSGSRFLRML